MFLQDNSILIKSDFIYLQRLLQTHASRAFNPSLCFSPHYKIKKDIPGNASKKTQWKQMLEAIMI